MDRKEKLIEKLFNDQCTREELQQLLQYIDADPERDYTSVLQKLWEQLGAGPQREIAASGKIVAQTMTRVRKQLAEERKTFTVRQTKRRIILAVMSAAAVLLLGFGAFIWYWLQPAPPVVIQTAFGEQKDVVLPDGTLVQLNANSTLTYPAEWPEHTDRQVWLEGEAFFEVRKSPDARQKFQVYTHDLTVEVLGTSFNVNTHQEQTKVFLEEGRVKLELKEEEEPLFLEPGEQATYSVLKKIRKKKYIKVEQPASWKDGVHIFENRPLWRILQRIEELYGIKIQVENRQRLESHFKIAIPVNDFETALEVLKEVTKLDIQEHEGRWIIL